MTSKKQSAVDLLRAVRGCTICDNLPLGPLPLLQVSETARVLIVGQAPGRKTHEAGLAFDDASGNRLRNWMSVDRETFYDATKIGILPMGFCYPGTGKSGDLPPRPECAPAWRQPLLDVMAQVELKIVIGRFARDWHLPDQASQSLTETVADWRSLPSGYIQLPHPSPRNNRWLKQNPWFETDLLPDLRRRVSDALCR